MHLAKHEDATLRARAKTKPVALGPLANLVGYHIAQAAIQTVSGFDRRIGERYELRTVEFSLMMLLLANGELSPKRLAATLSLTGPNLALLLGRLQQRALLRRQPNPNDGRSQHIVLTEKGKRMAKECAAAAERLESELPGKLTRAEHALLIELLCRVGDQAPPT